MKHLRVRMSVWSRIVTTLVLALAVLLAYWLFSPHWHHFPGWLKALLLAGLAFNAFGLLMNWRREYVFGERSVSVRKLLRSEEKALPSEFAITTTGEENEWVTIVDSKNHLAPSLSIPARMAPGLLRELRDFYSQWNPTAKLDFSLSLTPCLSKAEIQRELENAAPWLEQTRLEFTLESPDNVFTIDGDGDCSVITVTATDSNVEWKPQVSLVNYLISEFSDAGFKVEVESTYSELLAEK